VILESLAALLTDPQGSLAYHLISTFTIGLIFLLALAMRRRAGSVSLRWSIASGPLAAARLGMLLLTASTVLAAPELAPMLSTLERYLAVAGGLVLGWAFLFPHPQRNGDLGFGIALAVCSLGLAVSALPLAQAGASAGTAALAKVWDLAGLLAMTAVVVLLVARRPISWPAAAGGLALLGLGFGLQLASGSPAGPTSAPLRIAELLAYPALSAAAAWALALASPDRIPSSTGGVEMPAKAVGPELISETTLKGLRTFAADGAKARPAGPEPALKGNEDTEQVAQLKAEFRLALQELADLSRERGPSNPSAPTGEDVSIPMVGSLGDVVQGMRRALTSALSCAELLRADAGEQLDGENQGLLTRLRDDVLQLSAQVNKLGELTSESAAQAISGAAEADLMSCLRSAMDQLAGAIRQKQLSFSLNLPEALPAVRARQSDLERLLALMIESAIASSLPGTQVRIQGSVERAPAGSLVSLSVTDSGEGFPPEEVAQAFQPWHQLEGPSSGGTRAFGISLAGLRKMAERLGGRVWVASELGAGTTITVLLPATPRAPFQA
jgi:signal transduction histidine kinase